MFYRGTNGSYVEGLTGYAQGLMGYAKLADTLREHGDRIKVLGGVRHFVAYAGPDSQRFHFNAIVSNHPLTATACLCWIMRLDDLVPANGIY